MADVKEIPYARRENHDRAGRSKLADKFDELLVVRHEALIERGSARHDAMRTAF
jgi:hypothetical protein